MSVIGLAITTDFPNHTDWYRNDVIADPGSFVIEAKGFGDFNRAINDKLSRELTEIFAERGAPEPGWTRVIYQRDFSGKLRRKA